jgi:catechol 2,3-dioxygenase-like lactoylglutathione lyase family enzyme
MTPSTMLAVHRIEAYRICSPSVGLVYDDARMFVRMGATMSTAVTAEAEQSAGAIVSPARLAHVVLRTSRFAEMIAWYKKVFNAHAAFENDQVAFLTYDEEHHRIALANIPDLAPQPIGAAGVHHFAFTYDSLESLLGNYEQLRAAGIEPVWTVNHGPTTSFYYADPDGNQIELQVDNFDTVEEAGAFFFTDAFAANPLGVDVDPQDLRRRLLAGEDEKSLKARPAGGPRGLQDIPLH